MSVIGLVGLPGSGKSEAAAVAHNLGFPVVRMGDVIRAECRDRGLDPAEHHGEIAQALREEGGQAAVAERSLPLITDALESNRTVLIDGIRSDVEVDVFEDAFEDAFTLISITAPFEVRTDRVESRGRDELGEHGESLKARDDRELGFGMGAAMDRADIVVNNTGSLEKFKNRIRELLTDEL